MKNSILSLIILSCTLFAACSTTAADQNSNEQETVYFSEEDFLNNQQQNSNVGNQNNPNMQSSNFGNQNNQNMQSSNFGIQNVQQTNANWSNQNSPSTNGGGIKNITIPNAKTGRPMYHVPIPASWKSTSKGFTGPNGLRAAEMAEMGYQSQMNEAMQSSRAVIQGIIPELKQNGITRINTFDIPSIAQCRKQMDNQQWKAGAVTNNFTTTGIEGITAKNEKMLIIVTHMTTQSQVFQGWGIDVQMLTSNNNYFEEGKKALIYALSNMKYDRQYIAQWNQKEQSNVQASNSSFQNRMRNNQANFKAQNDAIVGAQNDVNTMSMNGYYSRSNSQDRIQQSQVQGIYDRSTVQNPNTGQNWEVEGQAQQYWVDQFGNYIPSNNPNWNPNNDPNNNGTQWTQTQNPNGGNW